MADFITDFADQALLLPLAVAVPLLFAWAGWRRGAMAWVLAIGGTLGSILGLKLLGLACPGCWHGLEMTSPSGHTAAGAAIYGGLAGTLTVRRNAVWPTLAYALLLAVVIGSTRLALQVHSLAEVVVGGVVGAIGACAFALMAGPRAGQVRPWHAAALTFAMAIALHGLRMPAEVSIRHAAHAWLPICESCRTTPGLPQR